MHMNYELNSTTPQEIITTAKTTENYVFQFPILNVLLWLPLYVLWIEHIRSCISLWTSLGIILFFCLCLVYPMLTVSLDCPLLIAPSVFSNVYWVEFEVKLSMQNNDCVPNYKEDVFIPCLVYPMLTVSLDCPLLIAPSVFSNIYWVEFEVKFSM